MRPQLKRFLFLVAGAERLGGEIAARSQQQEIQKEAASQRLFSDSLLASQLHLADTLVIY